MGGKRFRRRNNYIFYSKESVKGGGLKMNKILIIEDEEEIAEFEKDYLEVNGFSVDIEYDGESGVKSALNKDYDLILLDLMLPNMSGYDICKKIRVNKEVPILIVSAKKDDIDIIKGLGFGANDYITKPFSPGELVARVKAQVERYNKIVDIGKSTNDKISIKGLTIDKLSRMVFLNGKEISLTATEFDLLYFLASNPNRVFSKDEIFTHVWGMESLGDVASVVVYIKKLREKLEISQTEQKYIETIWGVGYKFKK